MNFDLTFHLAHAIIEMDDIAYSEGQGPENNEQCGAWDELIRKAEKVTGRRANCNREPLKEEDYDSED